MKMSKMWFKMTFVSSKVLRNCLEIVWILVLAIILSEKLLLIFCCFTNKMVLSGLLKAKQLILVSKIILIDPYVTSRDLQHSKPY